MLEGGWCRCFVIASVVVFAMPHCRSAIAKRRRRERAVDMGFLQPVPSGQAHVLVDEAVVTRTKAIAKSLALHHKHNLVAKESSHFAMQSALKARTAIGDEQFSNAVAIHKAANRAKHSWDLQASCVASSTSNDDQAVSALGDHLGRGVKVAEDGEVATQSSGSSVADGIHEDFCKDNLQLQLSSGLSTGCFGGLGPSSPLHGCSSVHAGAKSFDMTALDFECDNGGDSLQDTDEFDKFELLSAKNHGSALCGEENGGGHFAIGNGGDAVGMDASADDALNSTETACNTDWQLNPKQDIGWLLGPWEIVTNDALKSMECQMASLAAGASLQMLYGLCIAKVVDAQAACASLEKKMAWDGAYYSEQEFVGHYGQEKGKWFWSKADPMHLMRAIDRQACE